MKTAKSLLTLFVLLCATAAISAQGRGGANVLNIGVGPGYHGYYGYGYYKGYYAGSAKSRPVISLSLDHKMKEVGPGDLTLGGVVEFGGSRYERMVNGTLYTARYSNFVAGVRVAYYPEFTSGDDWDLYAGLHLGFGMVSINDDYYDKNGIYAPYKSTSHSYGYGAFVIGGHYYFSNAFGMFVEVGHDITPIKIGVAFKF